MDAPEHLNDHTLEDQRYPFTPLANIPWINWVDRTALPVVIIGILAFACFLPFYSFNTITPQMPLQGAGFPPVMAMMLAFLLLLTRGAAADLRQLVNANKIDLSYLEALASSPKSARLELLAGLLIGCERIYSQVSFSLDSNLETSVLLTPATAAVCLSILAVGVIEVHLLVFCVRQVAKQYKVDLRMPELNNMLSNPLIRFIAIGLITMSFGMVLYQLIPYPSLQRRVLESGMIAMMIWLVFMLVSLIPLFVLKSRMAVAKAMEINLIRQAIDGNMANARLSQFGERLAKFSPGELMYYEDRVKAIWEWPIEAQIRRLIIFGLLPPLTWVLAAAVEVIFETALASG
jgi:hypothetical protein